MEAVIDVGLLLDNSSLYHLKQIIKMIGDQNITCIETSCGTSIVIETNFDVVYQLYLYPVLFKRISQVLILYGLNGLSGLVYCYSIIDALNCIVFEKLKPINRIENLNSIDIDRIRHDVSRTLHQLHSFHYTHGDVTLDNIGWSELQQQYVLYDFETVAYYTLSNIDRDWYMFNKSIDFWLAKTNKDVLKK